MRLSLQAVAACLVLFAVGQIAAAQNHFLVREISSTGVVTNHEFNTTNPVTVTLGPGVRYVQIRGWNGTATDPTQNISRIDLRGE